MGGDGGDRGGEEVLALVANGGRGGIEVFNDGEEGAEVGDGEGAGFFW